MAWKLFIRLGLCLFALSLGTGARAEDCTALHPNDEPAKTVEICTTFLTGNAIPATIRAIALGNRGIAYRELGQFDLSVGDLKASLAAQHDTGTQRMLAWTYRSMGRYQDALSIYTEVLATDPHWQGWLSRCVVYLDLEQNLNAIPDCDEALARDPDNPDALYFSARANNFAGFHAAALTASSRALELYPDDPRHLAEHAWALHGLNRTTEAKALVTTFLAQNGPDPALREFLQFAQ